MNATAKTRPCTACKKHFIGVADGLCPDCEKDREVYRLARKKGEKRDFIPYAQLLQEWRNRRAECREWRKSAEQAAEKWAAVAHSERERSYLLAVLSAMKADLDPVMVLADELDKTWAEIKQLELRLECSRSINEHLEGRLAGKPEPWEAALESLRALKGKAAFPPDMWRRLVQLAHPDKHEGSPAATEATRWLMENRP